MSSPALQFIETTYTYVNGDTRVGPVSFDVRPGELVHAHGDSGCGKSTLARCAVGLIPSLYRGRFEGRVLVDGRATMDWPAEELTQKVGLVLQNPVHQMLSSTVENEIVLGLESLSLSRSQMRARLDETLNEFGLEHLRDRSSRQLSGGEQQRVALAAIAARQPEVLVLDEPLSMLCPSAAMGLLAYLNRLLERDTAVLAFEHRVGYFDELPDTRAVSLSPADVSEPAQEAPPTDFANRPSFELEATIDRAVLADQQVLDSVHVRASGGEVVAVIGPNGAGKTTLLRCLAGLTPHEGKAITSDDDQHDLYWVAQNADIQIFNASVADELDSVSGPPQLRDWIVDAFGLREHLHRPSLLLSEGQKKRLVLAVALLKQPRHGLLLDEPSLGQGTADKAVLGHIVSSCAAMRLLVIVATHDLEFVVGHADRAVLLAEGRVAADGSPREILTDDDALQRAGLAVPAFVRRMIADARGEGT